MESFLTAFVIGLLVVGWSMVIFLAGAEWQRNFWKPLLHKSLKEAKQLKNLETEKYRTRPIVCGIDDRAIDCDEEICDRLMSPITKKHIEPVSYKY